jgi:Mor family transcriptional regulator
MNASGTTRFFLGLFSDAEYTNARSRNPMMFPFRLGSDQVAFAKAYNITISTNYRIVLRVSAFQRAGEIQLDVDKL